MTPGQADQIAALINARNQLAKGYDGPLVLKSAAEYEFDERDGVLVGCVQLRKVQWYQWEICHLSVLEEFEGKGVAYALYQRAVTRAGSEGASVLQCTIRESNRDSVRFFARQGFVRAVEFEYSETGNTVGVWLKSLRPKNA